MWSVGGWLRDRALEKWLCVDSEGPVSGSHFSESQLPGEVGRAQG